MVGQGSSFERFKMNFDLISQSLGTERVKFNETLTYHTYNKISSIAKCFYIATSSQELINILNLSKELKIPYLVLGNGTKVLVNEGVLNCLVIKNKSNNFKTLGIKGKVKDEGMGIESVLVEINSGVLLKELLGYLAKNNLKNIEPNCSINSSLGGSMMIDTALREKCEKLKIWEKGKIIEIDIGKLKSNHIIISVIFKFKSIN